MKKGLFLVLLTIFMMVTIHPLKTHAAERQMVGRSERTYRKSVSEQV
ncbi:hypothetical protein P9F86_04900 [Bacillus altitudinis]|nr:hypothetical protein [Bacillus altitudinis]